MWWPSTNLPGKKKRADKALVDILKNYMANKSFAVASRRWAPRHP
jgi:prefoldin subunit 5